MTETVASPPAKRGRRKGQEIQKRPEIPMEFFNFKELSIEEKAEARRKREPRSETQKELDKIVLELWNQYLVLGEPKNWVDRPVYTWGPLPIQHEETALAYIRKACILYGRRQILGERIYNELNGIKVVYIPFSVERRSPRNRTVNNTEETVV